MCKKLWRNHWVDKFAAVIRVHIYAAAPGRAFLSFFLFFIFRRNFLHGTTQPTRSVASHRGAEKEPAKSNCRLVLFDHILHRLLTPPSKGTLLKYITRCIALALRDKYALRLSNHSRGSPISRALTILSPCPLQHVVYNVKILGWISDWLAIDTTITGSLRLKSVTYFLLTKSNKLNYCENVANLKHKYMPEKKI